MFRDWMRLAVVEEDAFRVAHDPTAKGRTLAPKLAQSLSDAPIRHPHKSIGSDGNLAEAQPSRSYPPTSSMGLPPIDCSRSQRPEPLSAEDSTLCATGCGVERFVAPWAGASWRCADRSRGFHRA